MAITGADQATAAVIEGATSGSPPPARGRSQVIHSRARMPVLLDRADFRAWLNGADGPELLRPAPDDFLAVAGVQARQQQDRQRR
jgi:putative SOS response-associated peptidase YedK